MVTKKLNYTRLSKSRFLGLKHFSLGWLTAAELGQKMWPDHRMATVNARAIVRELLLQDLLLRQGGEGDENPHFCATEKAELILRDPSWICRYCSLDTTDSNKRLWAYPCLGCDGFHQVCRYCKRHALKISGDFPSQVVKVRGCPGSVLIPPRPEKKSRGRPKTKPAAPALIQEDLYEKKVT